MALPAAFLCEDQFTCSICLEVFTNPVSTPCGHSFCQSCISSYWDTQGSVKVYQCPLCKDSFRKRPELHVNLTLKEITEQFKQMATGRLPVHGSGGLKNPNVHLHYPHAQPQRPGEMPESIFAEMITRFHLRQTTGSTQATLAHPSDLHLHQPSQFSNQGASLPLLPYSSPRRFTLSGPSETSPKLPLCSFHISGLELFCRTDNTCVCSVCVETPEHEGHDIVPAKREWLIKKSQLCTDDMKLKELIGERERKADELQTSLGQIQATVKGETEAVVCAFSKMISAAEQCKIELLEVIERTRRTAEHRAQTLLRELEEEIAGLQKKSGALSQLAVSEDYILFLKAYPLVSVPPQTKNWSDVSVSAELTGILGTVNQIMQRFQEEMRTLPELCQRSLDQSVPRSNPRVRRVQEYAEDITLDPNTAHPRLVISANEKEVHCGDRHQLVPNNPERFDRVVCTLARQGFSSGRHYWEVEVGGKTDWDLGVASWSVTRKGKIPVSPAHGYWFLSLRDQSDYAFRTEPSTKLTVRPRPSRIGIFVDCDKGLVSFYNVEARALIYTFTDSFPDTIHPFFSPCTNKSGRNEAPLIICPVTTK